MRVVRTVLADEGDLLDIWLYIAQDNITAADRMVERLEQRCETLRSSSTGSVCITSNSACIWGGAFSAEGGKLLVMLCTASASSD